ncbi:MAG: helix-turn-helix transcriptional regulator [Actinobacteria bacterium]|nr:helix-turn-helix transcriptional regulator [Actinomycetota bacterium]
MNDRREVEERAGELERIRGVAAAILHPVRSLLMSILAMEGSAGIEELADHLEVSVRTVRRHIGLLVDERLVRIDREESRRGVVKRYYGICGPLQIDSQEDGLLTDLERRRVSLAVIRTMIRELLRAAAWPNLARRHDRVVANVPGVVDERGWAELSKLHHEMLGRVEEIMVDARRRVAVGAEPIRVISQQVLLETSIYRRPRSNAERMLKKS